VRRRFLLALLSCAGVARAQPAVANVPTQNSGLVPVNGTGGITVGIWLPDEGTSLNEALFLGAGGADLAAFSAATLGGAPLSSVPSPADAISVAYGVRLAGAPRTLVAVSSAGSVRFGTIESGQFVDRTAPSPTVGGGQVALAPTVTGGALLVSDNTSLTRWELGTGDGGISPVHGVTIAAPESASSLFLDGPSDVAFVGGITGGLYAIPGSLDAGPPLILDSAASGGGRIIQPITGIGVYRGTNVSYLLVGNSLGITVYDLDALASGINQFRASARIFVPQLPPPSGGSLTSYTDLAVTNLPAGILPRGTVLVGTTTPTRAIQVVRWDDLAQAGDAGLAVDIGYDPRRGLVDGGNRPDGGVDGGDGGGGGGGGGGGAGGGGNTPLGPGIPVDHGSGCAATPAGASTVAALLVALALLLPRRRRTR
jgi:uncharacterized protein (TIGR03382 family)